MGRRHLGTIAVAASLALFAATDSAAGAGGTVVGTEGYGPARWGMTVSEVETALHVRFDCSEGLVPGECLCPPSTPALPVRLTFGEGRLVALFTTSRSVKTARGIGRGSRTSALRRRYPTARLHRNKGLTAGLATFFTVKAHGHAVAFSVSHGQVDSILSFSYSSDRALESELCG